MFNLAWEQGFLKSFLNLVNDLAESRAQVYDAYADFFSGNGSSGFAGNWSELVRYQTGVEALLEMTSGPAPEALPEPIVMDRLYARLFQGVGERTVPLCASAYTGEHRMMCGADCRRMLEACRARASGSPFRRRFATTASRSGCLHRAAGPAFPLRTRRTSSDSA